MCAKTYIDHYNEQSFHWLSWRYGSLITTLKIPHRAEIIKANKSIIRKMAVGWCKSDNIPCRPKKNHIIMRKIFMYLNPFSL